MYQAVWNGKVIAESNHTEKVEGNEYFPRNDVKMEYLKHSDTEYTCPWKGEAEYFHLEGDGDRTDDGAWSYPQPKEAAKQIAGHIAFDKNKVTVRLT